MGTDSALYKTLLESTKAIPWKIDWATMRFAYIGPQIQTLLGWDVSSWLSVEDWASRMHPDDRERVVNFCVAQSQQGVDHEADYRALTIQGTYIWIRDVVHVVRNARGDVESLVGFMFDITERKQTEDTLTALQAELEALSYQDSLTGVANRRMFDTVFTREWGNSQRTGEPLSLVMLDIDYFKQYNDAYGHIHGDDCLKQVAQILNSADKRARDFFARYGGEEFVFVLPDTDAHSAQTVAERCRQIVLDEKISHPSSRVHQILTISLGVATLVPSPLDTQNGFLESVDRRLYQAKSAGRNRLISDG